MKVHSTSMNVLPSYFPICTGMITNVQVTLLAFLHNTMYGKLKLFLYFNTIPCHFSDIRFQKHSCDHNVYPNLQNWLHNYYNYSVLCPVDPHSKHVPCLNSRISSRAFFVEINALLFRSMLTFHRSSLLTLHLTLNGSDLLAATTKFSSNAMASF